MVVARALVPATGIALPLVSYGRSNLIVTLAALGMLIAVARATRRGPRWPEVAVHEDDRTVVVFSGGGTGGHLYPALALADALVELRPDVRPFFVGSDRGLEARVLPERGVEHELLPVRGLA